MANARDRALELVEMGMVSAEDMLKMALSYMSGDDVEDMLDANELSDRFLEDEEDHDEKEFDDYEDDGQPSMYEEYQDLYGGDDSFESYCEDY